MNPEKLHDALNQLPDEMLAAADALRQKKKAPIHWERLILSAACFALVLGALYIAAPYLGFQAASKESAVMQDAAMPEIEMQNNAVGGEPESPAAECPAEAAPDDEVNWEFDEIGAPMAPDTEEVTKSTASSPIAVTSRTYCIGAEEPDETRITIISTWKEWEAFLTDTPRLAEEVSFENSYEESYFEENQLIVVVTTAGSSSVRYEVDAITKTGTGTWELGGIRYSPEWFTDDMTQQCILVELPRMVEPEDAVTLNLETVTE